MIFNVEISLSKKVLQRSGCCALMTQFGLNYVNLWITVNYNGFQLYFENHSDFRGFLGSPNCESPAHQRLIKSDMINGHSYLT